MNTGQMMLTVGALILLGVTIYSVNNNSLQNGVILNQTEIGVYAISLATSYIQQASGMNFDEKTLTGAIAGGTPPSITNLTPSPLGRDAGEPANVVALFDDFDDFNGFDKVDTVEGVDRIRTIASVYYIDPASPDIPIPGPTFFKRMDVKTFGTISRGVFEEEGIGAASKGIDTIRLSYIFSYYN